MHLDQTIFFLTVILKVLKSQKIFIFSDLYVGTEVSPVYVPCYRTDHTYNFVIDLGPVTANQLNFGVLDAHFPDNAGTYKIDVQQLSVVPVPQAILLGMLGLGVAGLKLHKYVNQSE